MGRDNNKIPNSLCGKNYEALLLRHTQSCPTLCDPMDCIAHQALLSMGFSRQENWSGLPCPPTGDPPDPGIQSRSESPALAGKFFTLELPG